MKATNLELELQKVGFDAREASVYLASLELGPSPVQKIAQRAGIPRATVYLVLDDLQNKGVVTTYDEGKKTYYVAEPPQHIADLVEENVLHAKQQQETIKRLIPQLTSRGQFEKGDASIVKYYQGPGGLRGYLRDAVTVDSQEIFSFIYNEASERLMAKANVSWDDIAKNRKRKKMKRKLIVTGEDIEKLKITHRTEDVLYLNTSDLALEADIDIIGDYVGFIPYAEPLRCVLIKDKSIATTMKSLFSAVWSLHSGKSS